MNFWSVFFQSTDTFYSRVESIDGFYLDDYHELPMPPFAHLPWSVVEASFRKAPASGASSVSEVPVVWCAVVTFVSIHTRPTITDAIAVTLKLMRAFQFKKVSFKINLEVLQQSFCFFRKYDLRVPFMLG